MRPNKSLVTFVYSIGERGVGEVKGQCAGSSVITGSHEARFYDPYSRVLSHSTNVMHLYHKVKIL